MTPHLIHWSDLHVGQHPGRLATLHQLVARVVERARAGEQLAVIITGDVTESGAQLELDAARHALAPLASAAVPIVAVPGNHDCGAHGIIWCGDARARYEAWHRDVCAPSEADRWPREWWLGDLRVIGLDSQAGNARDILPPLARGEVGTLQLVRLEVMLQTPAPTVVILHHHPLWHDIAHILEDARELRALIERRRHVGLVLFGHQHRTYRQVWGEGQVIYCAASDTTRTRQWVEWQREGMDGRRWWRATPRAGI